ncbi:L-tyrosine/L-tryptophan isonitrile synthase family protein [Halomonas llamarensis]|uniref:L-tyrosine/L-tryptophan isonitrile synthase family protein n=1 Tax=Halomonas llamarensis TaxID=2945104 RepID=A0ABT0SPY7_9GAMM|nr:L-tyrosine/L-tryptophan isonitrile synthase family protein [Halomonas llamarensis]MCL7929909.1 L-tyrosine/L-tryptophan isonitrile synthase family protein [Halomonas llamarensis]
MNDAMALRLNATIARAKKNSGAYGVKKSGVAEYVAEALFDSCWYKVQEANLSRIEVRDHVKFCLQKGKPLELLFPIFSRKPLSPIKNRGGIPDLGEIHSITRFAEAAQIIDSLCPTGCKLTVLADGFKYNRACGTPAALVAEYQQGLQFWLGQLNVDDIVSIIDYEDWVSDGLEEHTAGEREPIFLNYYSDISTRFEPLFDPSNLAESFARIASLDDIGNQLTYTYWSIVTSTFYKSLYGEIYEANLARSYCDDEKQELYIGYTLSLNQVLARHKSNSINFFQNYIDPKLNTDLFIAMRREAWEAAIRYVAISLTDRKLQVIRRVRPDALKLTIHGKKGELHFLSATKKHVAMTAQHSTGGLSLNGQTAKVNFKYRLEREANGEIPVLLENLPDTPYHRDYYGPLWLMQHSDQPLMYMSEVDVTKIDSVHKFLTHSA